MKKINSRTFTPIETLDLSEECLSLLKLDNIHSIEDVIDYQKTSIHYPEELILALEEKGITL